MRTINFSRSNHEEFNKVLQSRVRDYFKSNKITRHANTNMVIKTIVMLSLYVVPFILMLTVVEGIWMTLLMWVIMGAGLAGIGLSIMHDANHGAYSKHAWVNKTFGGVLMALGGSEVNWKIQHNVLHHTYTNIEGYDEDIHAPIPILRFSPHQKLRKIHRFQFLYAWFFYGLMTITWFLTKDYIQTRRYTKLELMKSQGVNLKKHWAILITSKMVYAFVWIALPIWLSPVPWYISVIGYITMQFIGGLTLSLIFQPAHVVPDCGFPIPDVDNKLEASWTVHQLYTTANFAPKSRIFSWYIGGLNYQIEHHLFPNVCHVHYRKLSRIVRDTAMEYNLPYYYNTTFLKALAQHAKMLFDLGRKKELPEATA